MDRFSAIMMTVLKWEGGYVDHRDDPGGATNFGITHKVLAKWRGVASVTPKEVKALTREEAIEIFRDRYWAEIRGDRLPPPIDLIMTDGAVNHGAGSMVSMLQEALGVAATGRMDDATVAAVAAQAGTQDALLDLAVKLAEARKARYVTRPHAKTFIRGWRNRLNDVMAAALQPYPISWSFGAGRATRAASAAPLVAIEQEPISSVPQSAIDDEDLQAALIEWGLYKGDVDGLFGEKSRLALDELMARRTEMIAVGWQNWPASRRKIALGQLLCHDLDLDVGRIDGLFGLRTKAAFENFNRKKNGLPAETWRDELDDLPVSPPPAPVVPSSMVWPRQKDVPNVFGTPCKPPMKRLALPFPMKIAWDLKKEIHGFMIHEKVHDSAARVFEKIYAHYGDDGIEEIGINLFGGCYNCKKITGGSGKNWSMHSWGIAIDFDPARNQLHSSHKQARLAKPDAVKFWELWEEEGWLSLGRARDFDWMHVQAARL